MFETGDVNGAVIDKILARTSSAGATAWYLTDKLGTVRDIVSSAGTELDHIVYDSFGNILTETNATNGDRFKYAGMESDAVTGGYYDRARYYNPASGRFERTDPKNFPAGDTNLYRYVNNNPINAVDPNGMGSVGIDSNGNIYELYPGYTQTPTAYSNGQNESGPAAGGGGPRYDKNGGEKVTGQQDEEFEDYRNNRKPPKDYVKDWEDSQRRPPTYYPQGGRTKQQTQQEMQQEADDYIKNKENWAVVGYLIIAYWILSEGSRIAFPPRNLIPIP